MYTARTVYILYLSAGLPMSENLSLLGILPGTDDPMSVKCPRFAAQATILPR